MKQSYNSCCSRESGISRKNSLNRDATSETCDFLNAKRVKSVSGRLASVIHDGMKKRKGERTTRKLELGASARKSVYESSMRIKRDQIMEQSINEPLLTASFSFLMSSPSPGTRKMPCSVGPVLWKGNQGSVRVRSGRISMEWIVMDKGK